MNNADFRGLLSTSFESTDSHHDPANASRPRPSLSQPKPGGFLRPRSVKSNTQDLFSRHHASVSKDGEPPSKKFKSSTVKGTKLAEGYHDRTLDRRSVDANEDSKEKRVEALEEQMKLGQIDRNTFENLRDEITGGSLDSTHLVKGLDRKLLERVRRGENVLKSKNDEPAEDGTRSSDVCDDKQDEEQAFNDIERAEVAPVKRKVVEKKGQIAPPPNQPASNIKRSRNELLAEFRAQRKAQEETQAAARRDGWKKELDPGSSRLERDAKGREVLITVDENGNEKRKVRKRPAPAEPMVVEFVVPEDEKPVEEKRSYLKAKRATKKKRGQVLGDDAQYTDLVEQENQKAGKIPDESASDSDDDIFEGIGDDYDPLAGLEDETSDVDDKAKIPKASKARGESPEVADLDQSGESKDSDTDGPASPVPLGPDHDDRSSHENLPAARSAPRRNYFTNDAAAEAEKSPDPQARYKDPELLAALKRASEISKREDVAKATESSKPGEGSTAAERLLGRRDRDYEDMDMGFGASRGDDEEEGDGAHRVKLSEWKGLADDGEDDDKATDRGGQGQRKRGKKKRKGDKNSASDVLRVMEGRK